MDERKQEGELHLLGGSTVYKQDYAPEVLEAFTNKHQGNDYWVRFNCPEFTSLCPITGQPDFATIHIDYIPVRYSPISFRFQEVIFPSPCKGFFTYKSVVWTIKILYQVITVV